MTENKEKKLNTMYLCVFLCLSALLMWRCRYGYAVADEVFYLATPFRLTMGDGLMAYEWHQSQLSSVLLMPLVKAYTSLTQNTEGMVLAFRYICTSTICLASLYIFLRIRKLNDVGAFFAVLCFMLYVPFGIPALSYNSMGIIALTVSLVTVLCAEKNKSILFAMAGVFYAAAVLCCPYLALTWLIQGITVLIGFIRGRKTYLKEFLFFTLGAAIVAIVFVLFVLSRAGIDDIINALPNILDDPEHRPQPFLTRAKTIITDLVYAGRYSHYIYAALTLLFGLCFADRKRSERGAYYLCAAVLGCIALIISLSTREHINLLIFPVNVLGLMVFMLSREEKIKRLFYSLWLPGMFYALCIYFSSNLSFIAVSSASSVASIGSVMMLALYVSGSRALKNRRMIKAAAAVFILFYIGILGYFRINKVYSGETLSQQTVLISDGIQKGIVCSEKSMKNYYPLLADIREIKAQDYEKLLFISSETGCYIEGGFENCSYSAWISGVTENTINRLRIYWSLNPEKLPEAVYTEKENYELVLPFCQELGLESTELGYGYLFK